MSSPWYLVPSKATHPQFRLVCFSHAGGSATAFHRWVEHLPADVELRAAQLPGRGMRLREPAFRRLDDLVSAITPEVVDDDLPYALFGHSLGATLAFEIAREVRRRGLTAPRALFVSCRPAPCVPRDQPPIFALPDADFLATLRQRYGEADAGLRHPELVKLMLPALKADLEMLETWTYRAEPPLEIPIHAFGALRDASFPRADLERWRELAGDVFTLDWLPGEHFHYMTDPIPQVSAVVDRLVR